MTQLSGYDQQQFSHQQQQQPHVPATRPHLEQRHTYPIPDYTTTTAMHTTHPHPLRSETDPYAVAGVPQAITTGWAGADASGSGSSATGTGSTGSSGSDGSTGSSGESGVTARVYLAFAAGTVLSAFTWLLI